MLRLAVIGKDVSRSQSPALHHFILDEFGCACTYDKISVPPETMANSVERLFERYDGFNVTIPYKEAILPYLKELRGDARKIRAVNTVLTSSRTGYNTDGGGFLLMLQTEEIELRGKRVLVLGAGGAGRSCIAKLTEAGAEVSVYNRSQARLMAAYKDLGGFQPLREVPEIPFDIVVNCTGVGMHDSVGESPVKEETVGLCTTAVDLIYEPAQSEFLRLAVKHGKKAVNGAAMLFYQAYLTDCILLKREPCAEEAKLLYKKYLENGS